MGRPVAKKPTREASKEDLPGPEPEKIHLDDQQAIKTKLDSTVADVSGHCCVVCVVCVCVCVCDARERG
jgi:hypothetical protein